MEKIEFRRREIGKMKGRMVTLGLVRLMFLGITYFG